MHYDYEYLDNAEWRNNIHMALNVALLPHRDLQGF